VSKPITATSTIPPASSSTRVQNTNRCVAARLATQLGHKVIATIFVYGILPAGLNASLRVSVLALRAGN
jgi:hypothetical protein